MWPPDWFGEATSLVIGFEEKRISDLASACAPTLSVHTHTHKHTLQDLSLSECRGPASALIGSQIGTQFQLSCGKGSPISGGNSGSPHSWRILCPCPNPSISPVITQAVAPGASTCYQPPVPSAHGPLPQPCPSRWAPHQSSHPGPLWAEY